MRTVESAILSTDLAMYFKKRDNFLDLIDNGEFDFGDAEKKERKFTHVAHVPEIFINFHSMTNLPTSSLWNDDDSM